MRQIERGEAGIDREGDDAVRERDLLVLQPVALAPKEDADGTPARDLGGDLARGDLRRDHRLGLIVRAGGGGEQQRAVGDRLLDRLEQLDMIQNMIGAGGGALGANVRPAVAGIDDAQPRERKIAHRARGHADVLAELRLDQNDNGVGEVDAGFGLVGARAGHLTSLSDSTS